jgi:hypothetical protein
MSSITDASIHIFNLINTGEEEQEDVFTITGTSSTSLITPTSTNTSYDVSQTSFVIGSDRLNHDPDADGNKDKRMLFDKTKGAFCVGSADSTHWDTRGTSSMIIGQNCKANGTNSVSIGHHCNATATNAISIGYGDTGTEVLTGSSINRNIASDEGAIAIGHNNLASSRNSIAIGEKCITSNSQNAIAIGKYSQSSGSNSVAIGYGTSSEYNTSNGVGSFSIGNICTSSGNQSIAIGERCTASAANSIAIGQYCYSSIGSNSVAIGKYVKSDGFDSISIGIGIDQNSTSRLYHNYAGGSKTIAIGYLSKADGDQSIAIGQHCTADGLHSFAIGYSDFDPTNTDILLETSNRNHASGNGSFAIGCKNQSSGTNSFAIGKYCTASGDAAFAIGTNCQANGNRSFAIGAAATTRANNDMFSLFWNGHCTPGGTAIPHTMSSTGAGSAEFACSSRGSFRVLFGVNDEQDAVLGAASGISSGTGFAWSYTSDINLKENLVEHTYSDTLNKIMDMPIYTYNFKTSASGIKSIGPVAQDFNRLFPSDKDPLSIVDRDMCGVALAGVKGVKLGLDNLSESVDSRITALESRILALEAAMNP